MSVELACSIIVSLIAISILSLGCNILVLRILDRHMSDSSTWRLHDEAAKIYAKQMSSMEMKKHGDESNAVMSVYTDKSSPTFNRVGTTLVPLPDPTSLLKNAPVASGFGSKATTGDRATE